MAEIHSYEDIKFDVDLIETSKRQLEFLELVDKQGYLYDGPQVKQAIYRYEKFWLPLVAEYGHDHQMVAPLDIAWVWHCHMLAPLAYATDCEKLYGKILSHYFYPTKELTNILQITRDIWLQKYPQVHFEGNDPNMQIPSDYSPCFLYDLESAISRQKVFFYQVSLPHYKDERFLESSLIRYKKFLYIKKIYPKSFIVPCYDIDLLWHSHQLRPISYKLDTLHILGEHFNHDDSVNDRTEGSKLCRSMKETQTMWLALYNDQFSNVASMYRGLPPNGKLNVLMNDFVFTCCHKLADIYIQSIDVVRENPSSMKKKIHGLKICTEFTPGDYVNLLKLKKPENNSKWSKDVHNIPKFDIDSRFCDLVTFKLKQAGSIGIFKETAKATMHLNPLLEKCKVIGERIYEDTVVSLTDGSILEMKYGIAVTSLSTCLLNVHMGEFESCIMPDIEQLWGPVNLPPLPEGVDNVCSVASHKITALTGEVMFTCRIIHSLPLIMSAIHVFCKDKLNVVCQLIGSDQLPIPSQVANKEHCVTLDPVKFERAVLIKNTDGDWGILTAHWSGFRRGIPRVHGLNNMGTPGDPGHLKVRLFKMADKSWTDISLKNTFSNHKFTVDDTEIDLETGRILTQPNAKTICEYIAVAFGVSLLHVLCQPHPMDWEPGKLEDKTVVRGSRRVQRLDFGKVAMFAAAGMAVATPSNHHIRKKYGRRHYPCYMGGTAIMYLDNDIGYDWGCDYDGTGNGCGYGFSEATEAIGNGESGNTGVGMDNGIDYGMDGDGGGCGGCGGCGGGDSGGGWGGDSGGGGWGGDSGGGDSGGWGGDSGGGGGDSGGGDGGGCGGGGCGGGGCGGCGG